MRRSDAIVGQGPLQLRQQHLRPAVHLSQAQPVESVDELRVSLQQPQQHSTA
jgi:hypothetical protein